MTPAIAQIVPDGNPGGGTTVALTLVEALVRAGVRVEFLTDQESYAAQQARELGAKTHELPFFGNKQELGTLPEKIRRTLASAGCSQAHLHGIRASFFCRKLPRELPELEVHYTVHGYHFDRKPFPRRQVGWLAERVATRHLRSFIFVCAYDEKLGRRLGLVPPRAVSRVIYNGIPTTGLPMAQPAPEPTIVCLARQIEQKDPLLMVEIGKILAKKGIKSLMLGGGPMEDEVRAAIQAAGVGDRLVLRGAVPRDEALHVLSQSWAMVLPSRWEGFPVSCLEAMAIGVPVVVTDVCGVPEMIQTGVEGVLIRNRTAENFADALEELVRNPSKRLAMAEAARRRVREEFSVEKFLQAHWEIYGLGRWSPA